MEHPAATPRASSDAHLILIALVGFSILSLAASVTSEAFLEADGCTHYLYSRFVFDEPHYLVNIWGRPICTALYAIPALIGDRFGVRTMSLLLALATSLVSFAIARRQGYRRPVLALIFTLAQPLVFLHSFAELTELPFALLLGLAFMTYQRRRWFYFALLVTLLPLSRPEGFGFLALAAVALIAHRQFGWTLVLPLGIAAWSFCGWCVYGRPIYPGLSSQFPYWLSWLTWLPNNWPYAERSAYHAGSIFHFLLLIPALVSPLMTPALWLGAYRTTVTKRGFATDHRARCEWLIMLIPLSILFGHSLLYATGRMASSGELRYLLVAAPFWSLLVARGWEWMLQRLCPRVDPAKAAILAALAPVFVNVGYQVLPLSFTDDWVTARQAARFVGESPLSGDFPRVMTAHPAVCYFLGVSLTDPNRLVAWQLDNARNPKRGVMMVWDRIYGMHNSDAARVIPLEVVMKAGWIPLRVASIENGTRDRASDWLVFLSPLDINGHATLVPR